MSHAATVREVLRPRGSMLPLFLTVVLFWTLLLVFESMGPCLVAVLCPDRVTLTLELVLGIGLPSTYLLAAVSMATVDEVADPVGRFPALFDPPRAVRNALLVIATFAGVSLFLGALGALYLEVSVWLLVLLDAPVIGFLTLHRFLTAAIARPIRPGPAAGLALYLAAVVVQVGWWYVLAYGAVRVVPARWLRALDRNLVTPARRGLRETLPHDRMRRTLVDTLVRARRWLTRSYRSLAATHARRVAVLAVVLLVGLSVFATALTLSESYDLRPGPAEGDLATRFLSESSAVQPGPYEGDTAGLLWVVSTAVVQPLYRDYVVTINHTTVGGDRDYSIRVRVDNSDREYRVRTLAGRPAFVQYGNAYSGWTAPDSTPGRTDWVADGDRWGDADLPFGDDPPFVIEGVVFEEGDITRVGANDSTAVFKIDHTAAANQLRYRGPLVDTSRPDAEAYALVAVDTEAKAPRRITVVTFEPSGAGERVVRTRTVMTFTDWDDTDVSRPDSIPYTWAEVFADADELPGRSAVLG